MKKDNVKNLESAQQLTDKEAEAVNSGMKIVVLDQPSFIKTILNFIFGIKDKK